MEDNVSAREYLEYTEEGYEGIKSAITYTFKNMPKVLRQLEHIKDMCDKMANISGGHLMDNYFIKNPEDYSWYEDIRPQEKEDAYAAWDRFCIVSDDFDDNLEKMKEISDSIDRIITDLEGYVEELPEDIER